MRLSKKTAFLIIILMLALVLRVIIAYSIDPNPDEMAYVVHPLNILSSGRISTLLQSPLFSYLTDLGYVLFGFGPLTSRLPSVIFGSLAVVVVYFLAFKMTRNKTIGLISSFLLAISGYAIRNNLEPDITGFFFLLLSILFYVMFLQEKSAKYLLLSSGSLALAILAKPLTAIAGIAYVLHYFALGRKDVPLKGIARSVILSIALFTLIISPVVIHNYLSYQGTGVTDYYVATILGIGKNISAGLGGQTPWNWEKFTKVFTIRLEEFLKEDVVISVFGLLGLLWMFRTKNKYAHFLLLIIASLWIYLAGRSASETHYVIFIMLLSIPAGVMMEHLSGTIRRYFPSLAARRYMLAGAFLISSIVLLPILSTGPSSTIKLQQYAEKYIPENSFVVIDSLVYRGIAAWTLNSHHYLEGSYFPQVSEFLKQPGGQKVPFYYIECGRSSKCGWKPEDYERAFPGSEQLKSIFTANFPLVGTVKGHDVIEFYLYRGELNVPSELFPIIDSTQQFYYYPVGWKNTQNLIDAYRQETVFDTLLLMTGRGIMKLNLLLALLAPLYLLSLLRRQHQMHKG